MDIYSELIEQAERLRIVADSSAAKAEQQDTYANACALRERQEAYKLCEGILRGLASRVKLLEQQLP
mgnify:CR=1 FL=1